MNEQAQRFTFEQWRTFLNQPHMQRAARRHEVRNIFPALCEWYTAQFPQKERHIAIVLDAVLDSWHPNITYRNWAAQALGRLGLEFADEEKRVVPLFQSATEESE